MNCSKVGELILQLRKEKGFTQKQLAYKLNIRNKTISKLECRNGAPDASIWKELSVALVVDILKLLQSKLNPNQQDVGKIDRICFYICPTCKNILTSTGKASISCCGRILQPLIPALYNAKHEFSVQEMDSDYYVSIKHEMSKLYYILFAAYACNDHIWFQRLYPEQNPAFRMPIMGKGGNLYLYCIKHGLFKSGLINHKTPMLLSLIYGQIPL